VNGEDYVPTLSEARPAKNTRRLEPVTVQGRKGVLVRKVSDSGRYQYGGPLQGLWVDQVAEENYQVMEDDPLSQVGFSSFASSYEREVASGAWRAKSESSARVWTERDAAGGCHFKYEATLRTFIATAEGVFEPFVEKSVEGSIPRIWV
jgi:hypothetical protein